MPLVSGPSEESRESLYAILNLPISASQDAIRHRYKELAVVFHPDRQSHKDENTTKIAERNFRDIQRAHEILTNPELRRVYDTLGEAGLTAYRAVGHRNSSPDKLRADFERLVAEATNGSRSDTTSSGQLICAFDIANAVRGGHPPGLRGLSGRIKGVKTTYLDVTHTMEMKINNEIQAELSAELSAVPFPQGPRDYGNVVGTIRHQFSPRLQFEVAVNLLRSHAAVLKTSYRDDENEVSLRTVLSPRTTILPPPITLQLQRKLFVNSLVKGTLKFHMGAQPRFSAGLFSPLRHRGIFEWRAGIEILQYPSLTTEVKTRPLSGGFSAAFGVEFRLVALLSTVTAQWTDGKKHIVSVKIGVGSGNVFWTITLERLGQRIMIPIVLSHEVDVLIGMCALLVPSALAALAHNLVVRPKVRARRLSKLQAARDARHDSISQRKEDATKTITLLSESAQRRAEHERAIDGLVILTAEYVTSADDEDVPVAVDVTVPMRAQVHNSQLTIPGGRSKSGLLGFYDPSPGSRKRLKINYLFHGRLHVADVGDFAQVVLPLRGHLVE